jgi:hypothetical protein
MKLELRFSGKIPVPMAFFERRWGKKRLSGRPRERGCTSVINPFNLLHLLKLYDIFNAYGREGTQGIH